MLAKVLRRSVDNNGSIHYYAALRECLCGAAAETWLHEVKQNTPEALALVINSLTGEYDT